MAIFVPAVLCLGLMIFHSVKTRGVSFTMDFFMASAALFLVKGAFDFQNADLDYRPTMEFLKVGDINYGVFLIILPVGWTFAAYSSLCIAEELMRLFRASRLRFGRINLISILTFALIGVCMEGCNQKALWWTWKEGISNQSAAGYFSIWMVWGIIFFPFFLINYLDVKKRGWLWLGSIGYIAGTIGLFILLRFYLYDLRNYVILIYPLFFLFMGLRKKGPKLISIRIA